MYALTNAKLLVMPAWLESTLQSLGKTPADIITDEGLLSILSETDVHFYKRQVSDLLGIITPSRGQGISPVQAAIQSVKLLHSNHLQSVGGLSSISEEYVKINTLYGKKLTGYDFFDGESMLGYLPRTLMAGLSPEVKVDPLIERAGNDLLLLRFSLGFYDKNPVHTFITNSVKLLMNEYGFDIVAKTKLFDFYSVLPVEE